MGKMELLDRNMERLTNEMSGLFQVSWTFYLEDQLVACAKEGTQSSRFRFQV
jgi:hypothetical protein